MKEIEQVYHNEFGISFYWKKEQETLLEKIQLVFKETGFYLTVKQLKEFCEFVQLSQAQNDCCDDCVLKQDCHKFLLKTPCNEIELAVSVAELHLIEDLIRGTLFSIQIDEFINGVGRN
ncbi:hypothetical protein ACRASX_03770 [Flavobacterium sp. TMP13]|uniref:hypothetical protein n=1 Tax=unclassified Flavobacterium TaxID=196869 RepID=UPI00076CF3A7|nr:hypothetical protein [Flavobacterium sp. TAB 87]KVV13211.1 hypothetical protein AP058_02573 [Flavobacterium sp. TAB 87]